MGVTGGKDLEPFSEAVGDVFHRLGLGDPSLLSSIAEGWDQWAGHPWAGRSRPVLVRGKTLVVEASTPAMVAFLRYAEQPLLEALDDRVGPGIIEAVEVRPPRR